jgi:type VI secretion system protein ImpK
MSSDNSDKTVFRKTPDAQAPRADSTVIRPTPGRRSGQAQAPRAPDATQLQNPGGGQAARAAHAQPDPAQFKTLYGLNPIVNAASVLIAVFHKTRQTVSHPNVGGLHQQLTAATRNFEVTLQGKNVSPEMVLAARYLLCAALDEAVMNTPWGAESAWPQRTLLSTFHNETHGGEKFFLLLDKMKERPAQNLDILELMYILLSLGFEGKYRMNARGREMIEKIRDDLFQTIRTFRGEYERALSPSWQGLGRANNTLAQYVPMWVVASVLAGVLVLTYSGFRFWMYHSTDHVVQQFDEISVNGASKKPSSNSR